MFENNNIVTIFYSNVTLRAWPYKKKVYIFNCLRMSTINILIHFLVLAFFFFVSSIIYNVGIFGGNLIFKVFFFGKTGLICVIAACRPVTFTSRDEFNFILILLISFVKYYLARRTMFYFQYQRFN